ncbi:MAG: hypothetical protein WCK41_00035 [Actinomycetes bacterium]
MSDTSQGPGWWQASDGKWYPPEQAPGAAPVPSSAGGSGASTLDIGAAIGYGWTKFVENIGVIIVMVLIIFGVQIVFNIAQQSISGGINSFFLGSAIGFMIWAAGWFLYFMLSAGLIRVALAITRGEKPETAMLFSTERLGPFAMASIIVSLLTFVGFFFCCVGALVVMFFTYFYGFYVLDRNQGPTESVSSSFSVVKENAGAVAGLLIILVLINVFTCGLGVGVTFIAGGYAYRVLNGETVS